MVATIKVPTLVYILKTYFLPRM